jgi:hypothetical protein
MVSLACRSEEDRQLERFGFDDVCSWTRAIDGGQSASYSVDAMQSSSQN